ncbi:RNA-directed DNA polymerase from mobile element jockey [Eumeta japonica]|uniref:RNA-directed DNA polymerase from mobile element jockey n=1 Tax=Eumeta variegata TaxID=151549 RepID=A0A4C1UK62_EUMVA|nr:RNA-directed DNA polymerase from mobile element jockey [Eumeta japonica]
MRRDVVHGGLELPDFIDTRTIEIRMDSARTELRLFVAYRPPLHFCSSDIRTIFGNNTSTILTGNLNAKHTAWGSTVVSPAGCQLLQDAEDYGYEVFGPDTPSHVPTDTRFGADDRAEILAKHLEEQFTPHPASDSRGATLHQEHVGRRLRQFLSAPVPPLQGDYYMSPAETAKAIFRLPKRKSPEPDGISSIAIKQPLGLPQRAMVAMTRPFNGILWTEHFPVYWKMGRVIAIPKAGKEPRLASSQRLITLLSHIAMLFERIMLQRLHLHLTPKQEQFMFRSGQSTTLYENPDHTCARVDSGVVPGGLQLLCNSRGGDFGSATHPRRGTAKQLPMHAVLTDDIPTLAGQLQDWEEDVVLALYADDSAYLASSRRADLAVAKLQRVLDRPDWLDKWRVAVNVTKTAGLLTGQQCGVRHPPEQSRVENAKLSSSITLTASNQSGSVQGLHPFSGRVCSSNMVRTLLHTTEEED